MKNNLNYCPKCNSHLRITRYDCCSCGSRIEGDFAGCAFCQLDEEDRLFAIIFIQTEGNMKDVERVMGISYPTVKSRLARLNAALAGETHIDSLNQFNEKSVKHDIPDAFARMEILDQLASGKIDSSQAVKLLRGELID